MCFIFKDSLTGCPVFVPRVHRKGGVTAEADDRRGAYFGPQGEGQGAYFVPQGAGVVFYIYSFLFSMCSHLTFPLTQSHS